MTDDRAEAALNDLRDTLGAAVAEHERLKANADTADQNLAAFADAITAAADSLRATLPQPALAETE